MPIVQPKLSPEREKKRKLFMSRPTGPSMTKTEFSNDSDINTIMHRFIKTGVLPESRIDPNNMNYGDVSQFGDYQTNLERVRNAEEQFYQYPAELREAMKNDPSQLHNFLKDPKNYDLLKKHKLIKNEKVAPALDPVVKELRSLKTELTKQKNSNKE